MTPIESIYDIKAAVLALQKYLLSRDTVVSKRVHIRYEERVDRFFRENSSFLLSNKEFPVQTLRHSKSSTKWQNDYFFY